MTMKNATILASQSSLNPLGSFAGTLFVNISEFLSGAVRPFHAGSSRFFVFFCGEARAGPAFI